jgi:pyruvate kinase
VMLSEETAVGRHPVRAVEVMATIALETERGVLQGPHRPACRQGRRRATRRR